jgi:hypothetical protein
MDIELRCMHDSDDRIRVERDSDGEIAFYTPGASVYATDEDARAFARKILTLVGDEPAPAAEVVRPKVGDRLTVTTDNPRCAPVVRGDVITVAATDYGHDSEDCVRFRHGRDDYLWFVPLSAVEPVDEVPAELALATDPRVTALETALRIAGPDAPAAEVLAYAAFLAA